MHIVYVIFYSIFIFGHSSVVAFEIPSVHYPVLLKVEKNVEELVPDGWKIEMKEEGDLNKDGIKDVVLVLRENASSNVIKIDGLGEMLLDTNPRILAVLFGKVDGGYVLIQDNHTLIPRRIDPKIDDYLTGVGVGGISVRKGVLVVQMNIFYNMGSWEMKNISFTFRWQNNRFELIGYDSTTTNRSSGESKDISVNYSTHKIKINCGNLTTDTDDKVTWQKLLSNKTWTIDNIGNGLEFNPGAHVACDE